MKKTFLSLAILFFNIAIVAQNNPTGLLTELLRAPEKAVITDAEPEFGWIFPQAGISQTACRVLVASSIKQLKENKADFWDSGKTETNNSTQFSYAGKKLESNSTYFWKIKVWGENGFESQYSEPQQFNTATFYRNNEWPGQSNWVKIGNNNWVAEDRQMATFQNIEPQLFQKTTDSGWFADFGKAAFGALEFTVSAKNEGEKLVVFLGERKNEDLTVNKNQGVSNIGFYKYEITVKKGTHSYSVDIPRHEASYPHSQKLAPFYPEVLPFRYVEFVGTESMEIQLPVQKALFYYFDENASAFTSPNTKLNKVWDLCKYTLKATPFLGVYCDGNRERMPYEADAYIQQLGHYSVDREFSAARYTAAFLLAHASWPTEWQMHAVMMVREHYMFTGDLEFPALVYDELKKKTLIALEREDGLISTRTGKVTPAFMESIHLNSEMRDIVDWPAGTPVGNKQASNAGATPEGERDGYIFTDYNTVVNAFHFYALQCMSEIAGALGKTEDKNFFKTKAEKVKASIMQNMFDYNKGCFVDGIGTDHASLHANIFPLAFNLVPEEHIKSVASYIKTKGMACSVYGAQYLLEALYNAGEAEYALQLMTAEDKRSWMNMIKVGSTMTTEAWDEIFKPNLTWNHAWGSAPANIIPRRLTGIQPLDAGFKTFVVNPQPDGLGLIEIKVPTIRGEISCNLKTSDTEWQMEISVPGNSEAFILVPSELPKITVNNNNYQAVSQIHYLGRSRNLLRLKGGNYLISAKIN